MAAKYIPPKQGTAAFAKMQDAIYQDSLANTAYQQTNNPTYKSNSTVQISPSTGKWEAVNTPYNSSSNTGGGSTNVQQPQPQQQSSNNEVDAQRDAYKKEISSGWDTYIRGLDDQLGGLSTQKSALENTYTSQYNRGVGDLGLQRDQGLQELGQDRTAAMQNQTSNLRDIAGNIRNAFQAGNVYLGARGAGDSSAANQYSFALNKMGTQQRSDVMNNTANILADVESRETNLNNIYNKEINNLGEVRNQQLNQVSMWFADAQNQIKQAQNEGRFNKSKEISDISRQILNEAIAKVNQIDQMVAQRKQALEQWAMGVSADIGQLRSNMQQVSQVNYDMPQAQQIAGAPQVDSSGNMMTSFGGGGSWGDEEKRNGLFYSA